MEGFDIKFRVSGGIFSGPLAVCPCVVFARGNAMRYAGKGWTPSAANDRTEYMSFLRFGLSFALFSAAKRVRLDLGKWILIISNV